MKDNTFLYNTALYLRLSKDDGDKEESNSIESQRHIVRDFIECKPELRMYREYIDDGFTGTNFNRPGFKRMLSDIENGQIKCVIVKDLSRFGRNYLDTGRYIQQIFPNLGVRFIAVNDHIDTKEEQQYGFDMMLPIRNIFNESYSQDISRKVQSSFKAMQREGAFCGAHTSYGYQKSKADKHKLVIDPVAASVVRNIFNWFMDGMGQRTIAAKLNEQQIPCPSIYKKQNGENYRNSKRLDTTDYWTYSTVHRILLNRMYTGAMVQNKAVRKMRGKAKQRPQEEWIIVDGTHEPIIEKEQFERVQELLKQRTRNIDFDSNTSIFSGFLKCADCGRAMAKKNYIYKGKKSVSYTCGSFTRSGSEVCSNHRINHEVLENIILDDLNTVIASVIDLRSIIEEQCRQNGSDLKLEERELKVVKDKLDKVVRLKREAYDDYKEGLLSKEECKERREEYARQEQLLLKRLEILENTRQEDPAAVLYSPWIMELLEKQELSHLDRETVVQFLDKIEIGEKDAQNQQNITIHYRFSDELDNLFQMVYTDG